MSDAYKDYTVSHDWSGWTATLRIQQDEETLRCMQEMLLFWMSGQERIEDCEGNITEAWLLLFGETAFPESQYLNLVGLKSFFEKKEGWVPLDGSCGIELLTADSYEIDSFDFTIKTIETNTDKESTSC